MTPETAIASLAALANTHRLAIFRLLSATGAAGLASGGIAQALALPPANTSFHLKELAACGLIAARREGRSIRYAVTAPHMRALVAFLTQDCCGGRPELCGFNFNPQEGVASCKTA